MKAWVLLLLCALLSGSVLAQPIEVELGPTVTPRDVQRAKRQQRALAERQDVEIVRVDQGMRSSSRLEGVPLEFRGKVIRNERDLEELLPRLYPYYGFTGRESLRLELRGQLFEFMRYLYRLFIDGIPSSEVLDIRVNLNTLHIAEFVGSLSSDTGLRRKPFISAQQAIARTLECIAARMDGWYSPDIFLPNGEHHAELYYRPGAADGSLAPWWNIGIRLKDGQAPFEYAAFWVTPYAIVVPQEMSSHHTYESCVPAGPPPLRGR